MSTLTATAYHISSETLAVGDILLDRHNKPSAIISRFTDDGATAVCKTADGNWHYLPFGNEVRIAA
jgi:uncharacterized protein with von Willebrand factor type A (vWA) domain